MTLPRDCGNQPPVALILFGHGARDPQWAKPLHAIREAALACQPGMRVELAFLEYLNPTLAECVEQLVTAGFRTIRIFPVFIAQGGHLVREVPVVLAELTRRFPGVDLQLLPVAGESPAVIKAMAEAAIYSRP